MKAIATCLLMLLPLKAVAFTTQELPEDRMTMTKLSSRIVLIEVFALTFEAAEQELKGVETKRYTVTGKVLETLRGEPHVGEWKHSRIVSKVIDRKLFSDTYRDNAEFYELTFGKWKEGSEFKRGEKYLVIYWRDQPIFVRIEEGDNTWRKRIREKDASHPRSDP